MAEPLGLVAVGMTAAHIAKILFNVAQNYNSAREEISDIAEELTIVSQNMVLLNDILANHHDKCKPALFQQVQSIVGQFKKVEAKLNKVIDARKPLQRIRWFIDSPQTRALLTKIESIKTSLILVVGLIRLAHEQTQKQTEPATGTPSIEQPEHPASNKYRKVVESVILMNRLAVERAKEESDRHPTAKRRHFDTELRRWHIDSDDTATWLYTLVFTSGVPSRSSNTNGKNLAERSVTVEDYDSDASTRGNADIEVVEEDEPNSLQIVWTEQTNPDVVVDRLLDSWTKLTSDQVKDSGRVAQIEGKDETWGAELVHTLKERNKKRESKKSKKVRYSAPPVVPDSGFITAPETADGISEDEISDNPQKEQWVRGRDGIFRPKTAPQRTAGTKSTRFNPMSTEYVGPNPPSQFNPTARDCANLPPNPAQYQQTPPWGQPGPHPGLYGPWGAPPGGTIPGYPLPPTNAPQDTFGPSPQSLPKETPAPPPATSSPVETTTDYKKLQSTLERVIERLEDAEDEDEIANKKILSKVEDMIANSSAKRTEPSSQPTAEGAHEAVPEETRIRKLEEMLLELQDRQQKLAHDEVAWKAEKLLADAKALRASEEAKAATQRDLDKVRKAKKADNKTKRIDQQHLADVKAAVERRSTEEELKQEIASCKEMHFAVSNRLEQFMELHGYNNGQVSSAQLDTSEGSQKLSLPGFSNVSRASNLTEPSLKQALGPRTSLSDVPKTDPLQQINLTSLPRTNSAIFLGVPGRGHTDNSGDNGNLIVFPPIAPTSLKSIQLQSRLSKRGVLAKQEEVYTQTDDTSSVTAVSSARRLVQCTIFWEPPTVTMGSELVKTLQLRGWKPFYIRMSDAGQTYFIGNQPIHVNFFRPEYKPQFEPARSTVEDEHIIISKDLIEEYALQELGFSYKMTATGAYALDGRLSTNDIDALIDRSFMIRETSYRRYYRQSQWSTDFHCEAGSSSDENVVTSPLRLDAASTVPGEPQTRSSYFSKLSKSRAVKKASSIVTFGGR